MRKYVILSLPLALLAGLAGCQQPKMNCTTGRGDFAVAYKLTKGEEASPCGGFKGDVVGMQTYFAGKDLDGDDRNDLPVYGEGSIGIRPLYLGSIVDNALTNMVEVEDAIHAPGAVGDFEGPLPDAEDICVVERAATAEVSIPLIPEVPAVEDDPETEEDESAEAIPEIPPTTVQYVWSDLEFLVTPDAQGTQFRGKLKFTQDTCTAEYDVSGVYPAVHCEKDDDCTCKGYPFTPEPTEEDPNPVLVECPAKAGQLNPDFALKCDEDFGYCVLAKDLPSYK